MVCNLYVLNGDQVYIEKKHTFFYYFVYFIRNLYLAEREPPPSWKQWKNKLVLFFSQCLEPFHRKECF